MNADPVVLLLETESVARHALAEYLRMCGFRVVEATNTDEAKSYLECGDALVETALLDVRASGTLDAFSLAQRARSQGPIDVVLVGTVETAAQKAAELCESGPTLARPYEPAAVVEFIKRLRAERDRKS